MRWTNLELKYQLLKFNQKPIYLDSMGAVVEWKRSNSATAAELLEWLLVVVPERVKQGRQLRLEGRNHS